MGVHCCLWPGQFTQLERHLQCRKVYCGFITHPCHRAYPCSASAAFNTTAWLHRRRVQDLKRLAYIPDLSPIQNICCIMKQIIQQDCGLIMSCKKQHTNNMRSFVCFVEHQGLCEACGEEDSPTGSESQQASGNPA